MYCYLFKNNNITSPLLCIKGATCRKQEWLTAIVKSKSFPPPNLNVLVTNVPTVLASQASNLSKAG